MHGHNAGNARGRYDEIERVLIIWRTSSATPDSRKRPRGAFFRLFSADQAAKGEIWKHSSTSALPVTEKQPRMLKIPSLRS